MNLDQETNKLRLSFLQLSCLEYLYKEDKGDLDGIHDEKEFFQN